MVAAHQFRGQGAVQLHIPTSAEGGVYMLEVKTGSQVTRQKIVVY